MAMPVGVNSNFLEFNGKLYFAQADYTLTVLDHETGTVLKRSTAGEAVFGGDFALHRGRIVISSFMRVIVMDPQSDEVIWNAYPAYNPLVRGEVVLASDGNGLVSCRGFFDGRIRWTHNLPGAVSISARDQRVLLFQTYQKPAGFALLNLSDGFPLMIRSAREGMDFLAAWDAGDRVLVAAGRAQGERNEGKFEKLLVFAPWIVMQELEPPAGYRGRAGLELKDYVPEQAQGGNGSSLLERTPIPNVPADSRFARERSGSIDQPVTSSSICMIQVPAEKPYRTWSVLQYRDPETSWTGFSPYLRDTGGIDHIAQVGVELVIGTDAGHVECIDARTGVSKWLYVFPTIMQTISYSTPYGMPPYLAEQAAAFHRRNKAATQLSGLVVAPPGVAGTTASLSQWIRSKPYAPTPVIRDPAPVDPFRELPRLLTVAWCIGAGPIILTLAAVVQQRRKKQPLHRLGWAAAALMFIPVAGLLMVGRVAHAPTLTMKSATLIAAGVCVATIWMLVRRRQMWAAFAIAAVAGAILWFALPALRFA